MAQPLEKFNTESAKYDLNCTANLASGETITGTPTMYFLPALTGPDALTFGAPVINTQTTTYPDGLTGKVGGVIQVLISGGTPIDALSPRLYTVLADFTTNLGNTLTARMRLSVLAK